MARSNLSHAVTPLHPHVWLPKTRKVYRATILHGHACCECEHFCAALEQLEDSGCYRARLVSEVPPEPAKTVAIAAVMAYGTTPLHRNVKNAPGGHLHRSCDQDAKTKAS